jgi:hypothetical protein
MNSSLRHIIIVITGIFACSLTTQAGSSSSVNSSDDKNLTPPVTVDKGGRMNLFSGHSITLKPGTRVIAGGYLHAAIVSDTKEQRPGTHKTRISGKTPDAEPVVAPVVIAETIDAISPFVKSSGRGISESDKKEESIVAQVSEVTGISPAPQFKHALHSTIRKNSTTHRMLLSCSSHFIPLSKTPETIAVLRL